MDSETFAQIMDELLPAGGDAPRLAVGVSGGGDSMALCLLAQDYAAARGGEVLALTVDHGLRTASRAEAEAVGEILAARGIGHRILTWEGEKPGTRVQERARVARRLLLAEACRAAGIDTLCLAHNIEDQAETFWMRLSHGSGLDGLAGMTRARCMADGLRVLRPLLCVPRAALRDYCRAAGVDWAEDPSNENEKFLRARLRRFEAVLAAEGLTPQRLAGTMRKLAEARDALRAVAAHAFAEGVAVHPAGHAVLSRPALAGLPRDIVRRVLSRAVQSVAPRAYPVRLGAALDGARAPAFTGCTVAGCRVSPLGMESLLVTREPAAAAEGPVQHGAVWDGRFSVEDPGAGEGRTPLAAAGQGPCILGLLGAEGVAVLRKIFLVEGAASAAAAQQLEDLPGPARQTLPTVRVGDNILSIPHLSWVSAGVPAPLQGRLAALRLELRPARA